MKFQVKLVTSERKRVENINLRKELKIYDKFKKQRRQEIEKIYLCLEEFHCLLLPLWVVK